MYGIGTSAPVTRSTGRVELVERLPLDRVHHLRADPRERPPSSATTHRWVFATELSIASVSSGRIVRRSSTSASISSLGELLGRLERDLTPSSSGR